MKEYLENKIEIKPNINTQYYNQQRNIIEDNLLTREYGQNIHNKTNQINQIPNFNANNSYSEIIFNNNKINYEFQEGEIIVNPNYLNDKTNENKRYYYRQSITNEKFYKRKNNKNEYDEKTEGSSNNEEVQIFELSPPSNEMRNEFREEIVLLNPKFNEYNNQNTNFTFNNNSDNSEINIKENEMNQRETNKSNLYKTQKPHIEYVYKKNYNKKVNNFYHKKSKTFIKQLNYSGVKNSGKIKSDYNISFPEPDKLNNYQNESQNSSLNENLESLKENIQSINNYNSYNIIKDNNINEQSKYKHSNGIVQPQIISQDSNSNQLNNSFDLK